MIAEAQGRKYKNNTTTLKVKKSRFRIHTIMHMRFPEIQDAIKRIKKPELQNYGIILSR